MKLTNKAALLAILGAGCGAPQAPAATPATPSLPAPTTTAATAQPPCEPFVEAPFSLSSDLPSYFEASVDVGGDGKGYALFVVAGRRDAERRGNAILGRAFDLRSRTLGPVSTVAEGAIGRPQVVAGVGAIAVAWLGDATMGHIVNERGQVGVARPLGSVPGLLARAADGFSFTSLQDANDACLLQRRVFDTTLSPRGDAETLGSIAAPNGACRDDGVDAVQATASGDYAVYRGADFKTFVRTPAGETHEIPGAGWITTREVQGTVLGAWLTDDARTLHVGRLGEAEIATATASKGAHHGELALASLGADAIIVDGQLQARPLRGRDLGAPVVLAPEGAHPRALSGDHLAWTSNLHDRNELVVAKLACRAPTPQAPIPAPLARLATPSPHSPSAACRLRLDTDVTLTTGAEKTAEQLLRHAPSLSEAEGTVWITWNDIELSRKAFRASTNVERYDAATGKRLGSRLRVDAGPYSGSNPVVLATKHGSAELLTATSDPFAGTELWSRRTIDATHAEPPTPLFDTLARVTRPALAPGSSPLLLWHGGENSALRLRVLSTGAPTLTLAETGTGGDIRVIPYKGDYLVAWRGAQSSNLADIGVGVSFARVAVDSANQPRVVWSGATHPDLIVGDLGELWQRQDLDVILPLPHLKDTESRFARIALDGVIEPDLVVPGRGFAAAADDSGVAVIDAKPKQFCVSLFDLDSKPRGEPACFPTRTSFVRGAMSARWIGSSLWLSSIEAPDAPARRGEADPPVDVVRLRRLVCGK
jgi:hypothetical protein